ncbi:hypothetical protein [Pseudoalteromonas sp. S558]|uniref:hypothetical protein n=1 Tax=Pseudoalteromonas sp. S558 TaxID=2066515 RepID=UPI00110A91B0|nr:hypothetical protein [Pseudoalteromonas sp. S558]TMN94311.1 hypothetical protein CWB66_20005 [Pseudoalteromonas sp. S558]
MQERMANTEREEQIENLRKKTEKVQKFTSTIAGVISAVAVGVTVSLSSGIFFDQKTTYTRAELSDKLVMAEETMKAQSKQLTKLKSDIKTIDISLNTLTSLPEGSEWKIEVSKVSESVSKIDVKLAALESALTLNPEKALAIPILRKDLDNAKESLRTELLQTKSEIDRIYDQNKWFLGLMFTMALSVLGMAISSFVGRKDT